MPERQKEIGKYRVDYAYPDKRIYIELDGRAWHTRKAEMDRDNRRRNELVLAGWSVPLYFTWEDLAERPDYVLTTVRTALR